MSTILGKLERPDLGQWRMVMADKELIDLGFDAFSKEEARSVVLKYYQTLEDLIDKYSIEIEADTHLIISPVAGHIIRVFDN